MTDNTKEKVKECPVSAGQRYYEKEAANWPSPIGWFNLSVASKENWEQRANEYEKRSSHGSC